LFIYVLLKLPLEIHLSRTRGWDSI